MNKIVLSIDPGNKKCGIAVVDNDLKFIAGEVVGKEKLLHRIKVCLDRYKIKKILIGSGTNSEKFFTIIKEKFPNLILTKVAEKDTTMQARKRYFEYYPPTGLSKILPISFRVPPRPYDDFAALVIAERFFQKDQLNNKNKENK